MRPGTFAFGENWKSYASKIGEEHIRTAEESLLDFLGGDSLAGKSFLDVGCGSGIFSYAAHRLGAREIVSFDADPDSVECCRFFHARAGRPEVWRIAHGSILDEDFISKLKRSSVVYAWGVLHHTGALWRALDRAASLVEPGGRLYIAVYNRKSGPFGSRFWLGVKRVYGASGRPIRRLFELFYMGAFLLGRFLRGQNPLLVIRNYRERRGMRWKTDVKDWLGGYPYEFASFHEVVEHMNRRHPDFRLSNSRRTNGLGNNWFLFDRSPPSSTEP